MYIFAPYSAVYVILFRYWQYATTCGIYSAYATLYTASFVCDFSTTLYVYRLDCSERSEQYSTSLHCTAPSVPNVLHVPLSLPLYTRAPRQLLCCAGVSIVCRDIINFHLYCAMQPPVLRSALLLYAILFPCYLYVCFSPFPRFLAFPRLLFFSYLYIFPHHAKIIHRHYVDT